MLSLFRTLVTFRNSNVSVTPVVLGRWGIQYDPKVIDCKVFQANEDHCGCCVVISNEITNENVKHKQNTSYETTEEYLVPYVI